MACDFSGWIIKDVVLLYSLIDYSCWGNPATMCWWCWCSLWWGTWGLLPTTGTRLVSFLRNRSSRSNQAFRCLQTWLTSWLQPRVETWSQNHPGKPQLSSCPLETMRWHMFIVLSHYILEWFVVLDNKYRFLWILSFVCLSCFVLFLFLVGGNSKMF